MISLTFYAPTFIDCSMTTPDKRGNHTRPTGKLEGFLSTRTFKKLKTGNIKATRDLVCLRWNEDTPEARAGALERAIAGMEELSELDNNPPLNWIPSIVKEKLK